MVLFIYTLLFFSKVHKQNRCFALRQKPSKMHWKFKENKEIFFDLGMIDQFLQRKKEVYL